MKKNLAEKMMALHYCIAHQADEDVCGHLCDLLVHFGGKVVPSNPAVPRTDDVVELAKRYGQVIKPIIVEGRQK